MIEPTMLLQSTLGKKVQRHPHPLARRGRVNPATIGGNAKRRQAKTGSCNAGDCAMILIGRRSIRVRSVEHQACPRIALIPKVLKRAAFEIFEKGFIAGREFRCRDDRIAGRRGVNN